LPSVIARDRVSKEDGVSTCPLCAKEPDTGDHLLHRCEGIDAHQKRRFSALREEMLAAGRFADLEECLMRMAGEGAEVKVEVADKVSGCCEYSTDSAQCTIEPCVRQRLPLPTR